MSETGRWRGAVLVCLASAMLVSACDETKAIHDRAAALETEGKRLEAADEHDRVCEVAPGSERCPRSRTRAAELRIEAAKTLIADQKFEEAKSLLDRVIAGGVTEPAKTAKELAESVEVTTGLKWEQAQKLPNGRQKLDLMHEVLLPGGPLASKARAWLNTEGLPVRLDVLKEACAKPGNCDCLRLAGNLTQAAPTSKEAAEAQRILDAYVTSEQARILPLLEQLEQLASDCATKWKKDKVYQTWSPAWHEARRQPTPKFGPRPPAWSSCRHETSLATCDEVRQLEKRAASLRTQVGYSKTTEPHRVRMIDACYAGQYKTQAPRTPNVEDLQNPLPDFVD